MYYLSRVYAAVTIRPDTIQLVVGDVSKNTPHILYTATELNNHSYTNTHVIDPYALVETLRTMFLDAAKQIDLQLKAALITFVGFNVPINVHEINIPVCFNPNNDLYKQIQQAIKTWNKARKVNDPQSALLHWQVVRATNTDSNQVVPLDNLNANVNYILRTQIYTSPLVLVHQVSEALRDAGIKVVSSSVRDLDFSPYTQDTNALLVDVQANQCQLTYTVGAAVSAFDAFAIDLKQSWNQPDTKMSATQAVAIVNTDLEARADTGPINVLCAAEADAFMVRGVCANTLYTNLTAAILPYVQVLEQKITAYHAARPTMRLAKIFLHAQTSALLKAWSDALNTLQCAIPVCVVPRPTRMVKTAEAPGVYALMRQAQSDNITHFARTCVTPFYAHEFDAQFNKRVSQLAVTAKINDLAQKLLK